MEKKKPKRNVFRQLLFSMIVFGLLIGLIFPFSAGSLLNLNQVVSIQFLGLSLSAGLLVGLVNYLLFHLVISNELGRIIKGMHEIYNDVQNTLLRQENSKTRCELEVTSNDLLGDVILAFNNMGHAIDERQEREHQLRTVMNALSDSVDLGFMGRVILNHLPAPPEWQHALLYVVNHDLYHCVATMNVNENSVPRSLSPTDLHFLPVKTAGHFEAVEVGKTVFNNLKLLQEDVIRTPSHIMATPLSGDEQLIGVVVTACHEFIPFTDSKQKRYREYFEHVQPYLRSALLHSRIEKLATIDELSQTLNRRAGMQRLQQQFSAAVRHGSPLSLIMFDIDYFKKTNDEFGHQTGDAVIRELCQRIRFSLRDEDILFRYGGEEFMVILPQIDLTGAALFAERIRFIVRDKMFKGGTDELPIRISLGVVSWPQSAATEADNLISRVDKALYWAKENGRDQVAVQTSSGIVSFSRYLNNLDTRSAE